MSQLNRPITVGHLLELAQQLSPQERRALLDCLLAERFDATLTEADRRSGSRPELTDEQVQAEVDAVRQRRREDRHRAAGG